MGRSLRSSKNKTNNTHLRAKVYQPVQDARIERLSAKLLELAKQPKEKVESPSKDTDGKSTAETSGEANAMADESNPAIEETMDLDEESNKKTKPVQISKSRSKVQKRRLDKMVFAVGKEHGKKRSGKGYKGPGVR